MRICCEAGGNDFVHGLDLDLHEEVMARHWKLSSMGCEDGVTLAVGEFVGLRALARLVVLGVKVGGRWS